MAAAKKDEKRYVINVTLGNDNEPRKIFIGNGDKQIQLERGKDVTVTQDVLNVLDDAVMGVPEKLDPDKDEVTFVQRKRFPYSIVGVVGA